VSDLTKMITFVASKRGYLLVALALVAAIVGAEAESTGFGHGDW